MKYLVVSDNHGNREVLVDLIDKYQGEVDYMLHCGDSELDPTDPIWEYFTVVTGNCDYDPRFKKQQLVTTPLDKIYMTHGHLSNVRFDRQHLFYEAKQAEATIALYGHTHILDVELVENLLIVNPGSICQPRGGYDVKTYAIIEANEQGYAISFYNDAHQHLPELARRFNR